MSKMHTAVQDYEDVTAVVLAGGLSRRFGENKAMVDVFGAPLIQRVLEVVRDLFRKLLLVTNDTAAFRDFQVPAVEDLEKGMGPLGGIYTGLKTMETPYAFVCACDMPDLNANLVRLLVEQRLQYDVVAPRVNGWLEPLHAVYSKACLEPIQELLNRGERQIFRFFPKVRVRYVERRELEAADPSLRSFFNINTRADLLQFLTSPRRRGSARHGEVED